MFKHQKTIQRANGEVRAVVEWHQRNQEYRVSVFVNDTRQNGSEYFTDSLTDATEYATGEADTYAAELTPQIRGMF